jgi:uroporphyrin-3 C-methyltransferase
MMESKQLNDEIENAVTDPVDRLLKEKKPASSGNGIAILALLVALAAVSESAWQWWQARSSGTGSDPQQVMLEQLQTAQDRLGQSMSSFESQLNAMEAPIEPGEFSSLGERVNALASSVSGIEGQAGEDKASISALQGSVRSNELRLSSVESGLTTVAASSQNSSLELELAEIDFLLRVANERLQLFADPSAADLALQAADVQIEALNDPMFLSVRQRIATSRHALAAVPRIDRVEISARITAIQAKVQDLPFRGETVAEPEPELPADAGWWQSFGTGITGRCRLVAKL